MKRTIKCHDDTNKNEFSSIQIKHQQNKKTDATNNGDNIPHNTSLHNNLSHNTTKPSIPVPTPVNPYIDKVSPRRYMIAHMSIKDFIMGLLTQIPLLGGVVLYHKLVEIENRIEDIRKGDKNEQPKKQDNARRNKSDEKTHSGNIAINMLPRQDKHSQLPKRANL